MKEGAQLYGCQFFLGFVQVCLQVIKKKKTQENRAHPILFRGGKMGDPGNEVVLCLTASDLVFQQTLLSARIPVYQQTT